MLSHERARELFDYDPETGILTNRISRGSRAPVGAQVGSPHNMGYLQVHVDYEGYLVHRLIWFWVTGEWPPEIDHWNQNKTDNRWLNLRNASRGQNQQNTKGHRDSASGLKGVSRKRDKWRARIHLSDKEVVLGYFLTKEEAAAAYAAAAREHFGEFARAS